MRSAEGWLTNLQVCLTAPLLWRGFFSVINCGRHARIHLQAARAQPVANQTRAASTRAGDKKLTALVSSASDALAPSLARHA